MKKEDIDTLGLTEFQAASIMHSARRFGFWVKEAISELEKNGTERLSSEEMAAFIAGGAKVYIAAHMGGKNDDKNE